VTRDLREGERMTDEQFKILISTLTKIERHLERCSLTDELKRTLEYRAREFQKGYHINLYNKLYAPSPRENAELDNEFHEAMEKND
jgi:hypothetical protein